MAPPHPQAPSYCRFVKMSKIWVISRTCSCGALKVESWQLGAAYFQLRRGKKIWDAKEWNWGRQSQILKIGRAKVKLGETGSENWYKCPTCSTSTDNKMKFKHLQHFYFFKIELVHKELQDFDLIWYPTTLFSLMISDNCSEKHRELVLIRGANQFLIVWHFWNWLKPATSIIIITMICIKMVNQHPA